MKNGDMPAMPITLEPGEVWSEFEDHANGLTKREMMAMHMMPSIYNLYQTDGTAREHHDWRLGVVIESVRMADELLAELECTKCQ